MDRKYTAMKAVIAKAKLLGMNTVKHIGTFKGSDVWIATNVDENGSTVPTGMPVLITHKDGKTEAVSGEKAFQLFDSLEP